MNMKKAFLYMMVVAFGAVSCNDVRIEAPADYGELSVVLAGEPVVDVVSKAYSELTADKAKDYYIAVYDNQECTGTPKVSKTKYSELSNPILIPAGTYYVWAESCETGIAENGNGCMRLAGTSEAVVVRAGFSESAIVDCSVVNAKVSVVFDSSVAGKFKDNALTVTLKRTDPSRTLDAEYSEGGKEFWFNAGSLVKYEISGISALTSERVTATGTITGTGEDGTLAARDNIQLNIKAVSSNGILTLTPSVDTNVEKEDDITVGFNPYE